VPRPDLEVADILRDHGAAWRDANRGHVSLGQLKVMSAIERCRTAALGGHVARCESEACGHTVIAYNSCRNRHCPKCQGAAARKWLAAREAELLPVGYFHVVYTLPAGLREVAYQNKRVVYDLLMKAAAETTLAIAADPKRLGARIGITAVLHTWGSAMTHHPHVHMIVPGGGLSHNGSKWIASPSNFLVHVNVLARLFRGKLLAMLTQAHAEGRLKFFSTHAQLADKRVFKSFLAPLRRIKWVVYCKDPFAGPEQVLRYLSRYTHRVAISNRRLLAADDGGVSFRWKDYRIDGPGRWKTMTLTPHEFIRRFLMHVLPQGFHRIRHYGLFANSHRAASIAKARELLAVPPPSEQPEGAKVDQPAERNAADGQDRHLMMTSAWLDRRNAALARSWCPTGDAGACSDAENHPIRHAGPATQQALERSNRRNCGACPRSSVQSDATGSIHPDIERG